MLLFHLASAFFAFVLGALATGWCGLWGSLMGYTFFPQVMQIWGGLVHEGVVRPFLAIVIKIENSSALALLRNSRRPPAVIFGKHPSTIGAASLMHAISQVNGGRHTVVVGKGEYAQWFIWKKVGRWSLPIFPNIFLPVFGLAAWRTKVIVFIDRLGGKKTIQRILQQVARIPKGSDLLILPEGTRFHPKKLKDPRHQQEGCSQTLRYNSGGLWAILQARPPDSVSQPYFCFRWGCSKPDNTLLDLLTVQDATLHFEIVEVTEEFRVLRTKDELEAWLNQERQNADRFITERRL